MTFEEQLARLIKNWLAGPDTRAQIIAALQVQLAELEEAPDLAQIAALFSSGAQDAVRILNEAGLACPAALGLAAERARALAKRGR